MKHYIPSLIIKLHHWIHNSYTRATRFNLKKEVGGIVFLHLPAISSSFGLPGRMCNGPPFNLLSFSVNFDSYPANHSRDLVPCLANILAQSQSLLQRNLPNSTRTKLRKLSWSETSRFNKLTLLKKIKKSRFSLTSATTMMTRHYSYF